MCTIRNLPSLIEHCIEWSMDKFAEYFEKNIKFFKNFLENPEEFFNNNNGTDAYERLLFIEEYLNIYKDKSFDKCLILGKKLFYYNYNKIIRDILCLNPPEKLCKDGSKFWKGSNRLPHKIEYSMEDDFHYYYIEYFAYLLSDCLNVPINKDTKYKKEFINSIKISFNDELYSYDKNNIIFEEKSNILEKKKSSILQMYQKKLEVEEIKKIHEQIFEKDHDENHQVDFLYISSNLRAGNFNIDFCSRDKVKFISGKIVPSIPTTTSSIVGFISTQIYSLLQTTDIMKLRQINIDLSTPFFLIYKPKKVYKNVDQINPVTKFLTKAIPPNFTCWDYLEIQGNKTTNEVIDYINSKYQVEITGLYTLNSINIIKDDTSYDLQFEDAYYDAIGKEKNKIKNNIYFKVLADVINSDDHVILPKFKYLVI